MTTKRRKVGKVGRTVTREEQYRAVAIMLRSVLSDSIRGGNHALHALATMLTCGGIDAATDAQLGGIG